VGRGRGGDGWLGEWKYCYFLLIRAWKKRRY
jgi:hypothetical protein